MPQYYSPGVYVEEVPSAVKPIAGVGTSTAGFVGIVPDTLNVPSRVNAQQIINARFWCLPPLQPSKLRRAQRGEHGTQARR